VNSATHAGSPPSWGIADDVLRDLYVRGKYRDVIERVTGIPARIWNSNDLSAGILETIDVGSYRVEKREVMKIALADDDGALDPIPTSAPGHAAEPELDRFSNIMRAFTDQFGNID